MTVQELISINQGITDICIEVRIDGCALLDALHIGLDFGAEPPYPQMVPIDRAHVGNQCLSAKKKAKYIRKSINAWDDDKDYWQIKTNRIPKEWLDLEVYSWRNWHVYKPRHPRYAFGGSDAYDGIQIVALPKGDRMPDIVPERQLKVERTDDGQMSLFDEGADYGNM